VLRGKILFSEEGDSSFSKEKAAKNFVRLPGRASQGKRVCSFLKERTKELLFVWSGAVAPTQYQMDKSLFASFSSEKEDSL
jgi:hypothetical protein